MQRTLNRRPSDRPLSIEPLEGRLLLAGDVAECHFDASSTADHARAAHSINCFGAELYRHVQSEEGNLFLSPTSIATALAMFYEGTAGESATEMEQVLHIGSEPGIATSFASLFESFENTATEFSDGRPPAEAFDLALANAFWPQFGAQIDARFRFAIENAYQGQIQNIDYLDPGAKDIINAWVDENTRGKIKELFQDPIPSNTVFTLTNSIYFKALWEMPFAPSNTQPAEFTRNDNTAVDVDMMFFSACDSAEILEDGVFASWNTRHYRTEIDGFDVFDRQLLGERTSVIYLMPVDPDTPNEVTPELMAKVDDWMNGPREREPAMDVYLPKIETKVSTTLLPLLKGMMPATFPEGDFSNMMSPQPLISDARHKAVIEINEQGTEAAAVTSISGIICFAAGTPIQTPSGDVPVEDIRAGDLVLSRNEHNENGPVQSKVVEETFSGEAEIWELQVEGQTLRVTELHRFFVLGKGWTSVGDMHVGDLVSSNDNEQWLTTERIAFTGNVETVYNFRVADYHTYFVGKQSWGFDIWTHNCCGGPTDIPTFRADRPFHFLIRENQTSSMLFMGRIDDPTQAENEIKPTVQANASASGDFDGNAVMDVADANALAAAILSGANESAYDLNDDGQVNGQDLNRWRTVAGATNLPTGAAYPSGDANLDGNVDSMDLNAVGSNWQQRGASFSSGDLNADGIVDVIDLNRIGSDWLKDVSSAAATGQRTPQAPLAAIIVDRHDTTVSQNGSLLIDKSQTADDLDTPSNSSVDVDSSPTRRWRSVRSRRQVSPQPTTSVASTPIENAIENAIVNESSKIPLAAHGNEGIRTTS